jgi:hypothetical protein
LGRTEHRGQIPLQFNWKPAFLSAPQLGLATTASDFQDAVCGSRKDDGVDEADAAEGNTSREARLPSGSPLEVTAEITHLF